MSFRRLSRKGNNGPAVPATPIYQRRTLSTACVNRRRSEGQLLPSSAPRAQNCPWRPPARSGHPRHLCNSRQCGPRFQRQSSCSGCLPEQLRGDLSCARCGKSIPHPTARLTASPKPQGIDLHSPIGARHPMQNRRCCPSDYSGVSSFAANAPMAEGNDVVGIRLHRARLHFAVEALVFQKYDGVFGTRGALDQPLSIVRGTRENHIPTRNMGEEGFDACGMPRTALDVPTASTRSTTGQSHSPWLRHRTVGISARSCSAAGQR